MCRNGVAPSLLVGEGSHRGCANPTETPVTTHFASYDDPTVLEQAAREPLPPTKSGWIVSGLAAVFAASALVVVGNLAFHQFAATEVTVAPVSTSTSPAPIPALAPIAVSPAPAPAPAPAVAVAPRASEPDRSGAHRVVVITVPAAPVVVPAPVVLPEPVASSPAPVEPPPPVPLPNNPSGGISTCDLIDCHPEPPSSGGIPSCGDFRACGPTQPVQPSRPRD
jgi:hypothetical protein